MSNDFMEDLDELIDEPDTRIFIESGMDGYSDFYKDNEESKVWWIEKINIIGELNISFDRKKIYNLFADYPHNMTKEEVEIFDNEEPYWANFFAWRKKQNNKQEATGQDF